MDNVAPKIISDTSLKEAAKILEECEGLERIENYKGMLIKAIAEALDKTFLEGIECEKHSRRLEQIFNRE